MNYEDFDPISYINQVVNECLEKHTKGIFCPIDGDQSNLDRDEEYEEWISDRDYWLDEVGEDITRPAE